MSKDPAFLFYSSDFLTGTALMDNEQVGEYIRLMCLQHQKGHLAEKDMLKICGSYDVDVFGKFIKDENDLFYNQRLEKEILKRAAYSESRRKNREKTKSDNLNTDNEKHMSNICKTYVEHMENENENENEKRKLKPKEPKNLREPKEQISKVQFAEFVNMTNDEYTSLVSKLGEHGANRCIEILNNYKGAHGKTYKSDYRAVLSWVIDKYREEKDKLLGSPRASTGNTNLTGIEKLRLQREQEGVG